MWAWVLRKSPELLNFPRNTNSHVNCWKSNQVVESQIHAVIKREGENLVVLISTSLYLFVCVEA